VFLRIFLCQSINLECTFGEVSTGYREVKSGKECNVKNLVIISPNQQITSINGISGSDAIRNDVKIFNAQSQTINYFPRGLEKFFPNIGLIYVHSSKLKAIARQDLEPFSELKEIYLVNNDIEELEDDLFTANEQLLHVSLAGSKIKFIGEETFKPLQQLKSLWLYNNQCINKFADNDVNKVKEIINEAKISCRDETKSKRQKEITTLKAKVIALENENVRLTNQHELSESELETLREENLQLKNQLKLNEDEAKTQPKVDYENYDACVENLQMALKDLNNQQTVEEKTVELKCKMKLSIKQKSKT
jgi:Leucine-rich repeat (LRR) protein